MRRDVLRTAGSAAFRQYRIQDKNLATVPECDLNEQASEAQVGSCAGMLPSSKKSQAAST